MYSTSASVMKWSLGSQPVEESFSARVPRSSTEVRKVFFHDKKEVEDVGQKKKQQGEMRDENEKDEVNWRDHAQCA